MRASTNQPDGSAYFVYHSIGQYPGKGEAMARALTEFSMSWGRCDDAQWNYAFSIRQRFIDRWRAIIEAPEGSLTTAENVTSALSAMIGALPERYLKGRRLLVAGDCFPSLHFLLSGMAKRFGFTLDTVAVRPGEFWVRDEDVMARWGADVGVALLTWVTSTTSHRCDVDRLTAHGKRMGSIVGVDVTQAVGLLPFSVSATGADFTISTSLKWMCGSPGAGILQVAPGLLRECQPELRGWFSQDDIFSWDIDKFAYAPDIRRFDNGTPGMMACAATLPALDWHATRVADEWVAHNRALCDAIITGLDELRLVLVSPRNAAERGGSIMARLPERCAPQNVLAALRAAGVSVDARGDILRMSPGVVTTQDGVKRLLAALHAALR